MAYATGLTEIWTALGCVAGIITAWVGPGLAPARRGRKIPGEHLQRIHRQEARRDGEVDPRRRQLDHRLFLFLLCRRPIPGRRQDPLHPLRRQREAGHADHGADHHPLHHLRRLPQRHLHRLRPGHTDDHHPDRHPDRRLDLYRQNPRPVRLIHPRRPEGRRSELYLPDRRRVGIRRRGDDRRLLSPGSSATWAASRS